MALPPLEELISKEETLETLRAIGQRTVWSAARALAHQEARDVLNGLGAGRLAIANSQAGPAAGLYEHAGLQLQIAILVRLFDQPGRRRGLTDRLSFPVAAELLELHAVIDDFAADARDWPMGEPDENERQVRDQAQEFRARLQRLLDERPNRLAVLRRFRDVNIAHELQAISGEPLPLYGHVTELTEEALALAKLLQNVVSGSIVFWAHGQMTGSSIAMWDAVARLPEG